SPTYTITFRGTLAGQDLPLLISTATPGSAATVTAVAQVTPLFAAVAGAQWAVLRSAGNGETWSTTPLSSANYTRAGTTANIRLAVSGRASGDAASWSVYAAVDVGGNFNALYRTTTVAGTANWTKLTDLPIGNAFLTNSKGSGSGQGDQNLSLAGEPTNLAIVYIGGSTAQAAARASWDSNLWRGTATTTGTQWVKLFTVTASPHADSRNMVSSGGSLYEVDDGGIYKLANPTAANPGANPAVQPEWSMLVGNLQDGELRSAAYDTLSGAYLAGAQDNGTPVQVFGTGSPNFVSGFYDQTGGDGGVVAVDDV